MKQKLLFILMALLSTMTAWADVEINETNFPDENFRSYLLSQDYGQDGVLTDAEIAGVTEIIVYEKRIQSLKGIEFFTALETLSCYDNQLTSLDVSKNTALTLLSCDWNQLTSLDLSKNTALTFLGCRGNWLTTIDLSKNTALTTLYCEDNQIKDAGMDALVASLPTVDRGLMYALFSDDAGNVITAAQVAVAKAKGWRVFCDSEEYIDGIAINEENFPDEHFRALLLND